MIRNIRKFQDLDLLFSASTRVSLASSPRTFQTLFFFIPLTPGKNRGARLLPLPLKKREYFKEMNAAAVGEYSRGLYYKRNVTRKFKMFSQLS